MSERRTAGLTPFTKETAPRNGRAPGARNKINARAWKVIDTLLADYKEHGDAVVKTGEPGAALGPAWGDSSGAAAPHRGRHPGGAHLPAEVLV